MKLLLLTALTCVNPACTADPRVLRVSLEAGELGEAAPTPSLLLEAVERVGYDAIYQIAQDCELGDLGLPPALPQAWQRDPNILAALHELLMNREVVEGNLTCQTCGRVYRISRGVPVMRLSTPAGGSGE